MKRCPALCLIFACVFLVSLSAPGEETVPESVLVSEHTLKGTQVRLTEVDLRDRTDRHDKPVEVKSSTLESGKTVKCTGNLFVLEDTSRGEGLILVRRSPAPTSRPVKPEFDAEFIVTEGQVTAKLYRADYEKEKYLWNAIPFRGGEFERIRALQMWQRALRPDTPLHRVPRFVTNTWGDRSRDARISEKFILKEIEAVKEIGADVLRIDDGWQKGLSGNSAFQGKMKTRGLTGFWGVSDSFWDVHPERFPNGFAPIMKKAEKAGVEIGLWYAPDSDNELANWEKDAETIISLYKRFNVRFVKIDGLNVVSPVAQERVEKLLSAVRERSGGKILLMLDITGNHKRPGFLGAIPYGTLYVENRYTDWGNYWPHRTLRNLWQLAHWVDPVRLRFEFLNNTRNVNQKKYTGNPLAPANYPPDYLFASVMMSNPLGFFEASSLPPEYRDKIASIVKVWKEHRAAIFSSTIVPVGDEPSGNSWTGFMAAGKDKSPVYILCLREFTEKDNYTYELPVTLDTGKKAVVLHGKGEVSVKGNRVSVTIKDSPAYIFLKVE